MPGLNELINTVTSKLTKGGLSILGGGGNKVLYDLKLDMTYFDQKPAIGGITRMNNTSMIGLVGRKSQTEKPGYFPQQYMIGNNHASTNDKQSNSWYGDYIKTEGFTPRTINDAFAKSKDLSTDYTSKRSMEDSWYLTNDSSMDNFIHGLQTQNNILVPTTYDGAETPNPSIIQTSHETPLENNDPVMFGFDIIIDSVSSPLLNGSVEDFINQFSNISEIRSRGYVLTDFKEQFSKLFKTNADIRVDSKYVLKDGRTILPDKSPLTIKGYHTMNDTGYQAYLSYYLKKIDGLENLVEANQSDNDKFLVDYRKDKITMTFYEDVSLSLGNLAYLYKMLYWSRPNGKFLIPDNLLRFNCDIIVSEMRHFNRVKVATSTGNVQDIADNVSRYVYSLKECQFYFNKMPHDNSIDMGKAPDFYDGCEVQMDYKYSACRFERWRPDLMKYVSLDSGSIWKTGNKGNKKGTVTFKSNPVFCVQGSNAFRENTVDNTAVINEYNPISHITQEESYSDNSLGFQANTSSSNILSSKTNSFFDSLGTKVLGGLKSTGNSFITSAINTTSNGLSGVVNQREAVWQEAINKYISKITPGNSGSNSFLATMGNSYLADLSNSVKSFAGSVFTTGFSYINAAKNGDTL